MFQAIQQEVNIWKQLRHPNILQFFGACPMAEQPFMVCAFMVNGDANEYLRQNPGVDRRQLVSTQPRGTSICTDRYLSYSLEKRLVDLHTCTTRMSYMAISNRYVIHEGCCLAFDLTLLLLD